MNKPKSKTEQTKIDRRKRKPVERTRDSVRIAELYLSGLNQEDIAKELGISQPTISRDIKGLKLKWDERSAQAIDQWKRDELAYLLLKRKELEDIFKLSQNRVSIIKTKKAVMVNGAITQQEISEREELELVDTKIGTLLLNISDKIAALTGIEAPTRSELTGANGEPLAPPQIIEITRTVKDD